MRTTAAFPEADLVSEKGWSAHPARRDGRGRRDWWRLWYSALGSRNDAALNRINASLAAEYLDVTEAFAGNGVAIASPILFQDELAAGRLVPAHDLVASEGRTFWFVYPVARQHSQKVIAFRDWLDEEATVPATRRRTSFARR